MSVRRRVLFVLAGLACLGFAACDAKLPEPDSPGGRLYAERCSAGCHRLYAPKLMKPDMWNITVNRMDKLIERAGQSPLTSAERKVLMDYLAKHSG
jgi:hypothetical protein